MLPFKTIFAELLAPHIPELSSEQIIDLIEIPPQGLWADLAFPCFSLSKLRGQSPVQIVQEIINAMDVTNENIKKVIAQGPYINLVFTASFVLSSVLNKKNEIIKNNKLVLIESPSPNTNKPLHLGHVRNMILWNALAKIMTADGYSIQKVEVINDRGIHICKSMLAYQLFGNNSEPDKKSDHFVGDWYVRYATEEEKNPALKEQAQDMLRKREDGDAEIRALWKKMNTRAIDGMRETYKRYGTHIDDATLESDVYTDGKQVAQRGLEKWVFVRDAFWNIALPLPINEDMTSYFVVLRADGTTLYATQDLALVDKRFQTYKMNKMIYIVGNEQDDYFRALFKCFKWLEYPFADQCHHLSYGMIELPNGKMKSRTGNVIDADNLIEELHQTSFEEIKKRYPDLDDSTAHERAEKIALGAINFFMLKIDPAKWFVFDPAESLSFAWETGPYVQYTYARCTSLLEEAKIRKITIDEGIKRKELYEQAGIPLSSTQHTEEIKDQKEIFFHISNFQETIMKASEEYKPSIICRYVLDLCQMINSFYQKYNILMPKDMTEEEAQLLSVSRLLVIREASKTLWGAMDLICVPRIETM